MRDSDFVIKMSKHFLHVLYSLYLYTYPRNLISSFPHVLQNVKQNPERGPSDKGCNSTLTSQKQILMSPNRGLGIQVTFSNENYRPCKGTW